MEVVDDLLDRNTNKISTLAELARQTALLEPRRNAETWRKNLRRWRTATYKEADIAVIARAFQIDRDRLPAAKARATVAEVDRRLAALEATVGLVDEAETVGNLLEELATKLADVEERLRILEVENGHGGAAQMESRR